MHKLVAAVGLIRAPLVGVLLLAAVLLLPGQSREIFLAMSDARGLDLAGEVARTAALAVALASVVLTTCALLMKHAPPNRSQAVEAHFGLLETLAILLAVVPTLSVLALSIDVSIVIGKGSRSAITPVLFMGFPVNYYIQGAICIAVAVGFFFLWGRREIRSAIVGIFARVALFTRIGLVGGALIMCAVIAFVSMAAIAAPPLVATILGPFGIICLFFAILIVATSLMTMAYDRRGWPILSALAITAVLFAALGWNNNHEIRLLPGQPAASPSPEAAFAAWLEARPDLAHYVGRPYPVYVVAAEGGGLFAAAHAASVLARLQDDCPAFARHVFAISGVSGGSLGAAVFSSLVDALPPGNGSGCGGTRGDARPLLPLVQEYFENDFLTPLLGYTLFPDFLQRFLPFRVAPFDRARGLEAAFEAAWKDVLSQAKTQPSAQSSETAFRKSFRSLWSPRSPAPALLLNATSVQYGDRVVIAPFVMQDETGFIDLSVDLLNEGPAVALSTAVVASARFPLVTPAGWKTVEGTRFQIVDGAYYENSGIQTAMHLIDGIRRRARASTGPAGEQASAQDRPCAPSNTLTVDAGKAGRVTVCFKLILLRAPPPPTLFNEHGELAAPLTAAYYTRFGHASASTQRAHNDYCGGKSCGRGVLAERPHIYFRYLLADGVPLGWYFSKRTLHRVTRAAPETECAEQGSVDEGEIENACLAKRVRSDLN
jgi:hypothetical protein